MSTEKLCNITLENAELLLQSIKRHNYSDALKTCKQLNKNLIEIISEEMYNEKDEYWK